VAAELGHFALILSLLVAVLQGTVPLVGAARRDIRMQEFGITAARLQCLLLLVSFGCLAWAFAQLDFSLAYVAEHANSRLPMVYRIAAVWGAHEGSLLLWTLILGGWTLAVSFAARSLPLGILARVLAVLGLISIGFHLFMLLTSNPFLRLSPAPADGADLNPLLQDPGLVIHPPLLYMGYVGMAVPFAFAVAALLEGRLDAGWARWTRPWTTMAWVFLTIGITLGSWWAYYELGWGGWWFWDPVENASFMPWLVATALLHSLSVTDKRNAFKAWTALLAIIGFALSLLGTFLVRSGVLVSVHAFATDPARGVFILAFLALVVGGALALYAWRAGSVTAEGGFAFVSRESSLLLNNVLLLVSAFAILLGTLYPLLLDALGEGKVSVGPPYFAAVFVPLMVPVLLFVGVGPQLRWKRDEPRAVLRALWPGVVASLAFALVWWLVLMPRAAAGVIGAAALAAWVLWGVIRGLANRLRRGRLRSLPAGFLGMSLAHSGLAVFALGVAMVTAFEEELDVRLAPGDKASLGAYEFTFQGIGERQGPNYRAERAEIRVTRDGRPFDVLHPEKRYYLRQSQPMTEAAIRPTLGGDVYVSLGEAVDGGAWTMRLHHKPFVRWIWLGGLVMAAGGVIATLDRRYRRPETATRAAPAAAAALGRG